MEGAVAGTDGVPGEAEARGSGDAVEAVVFDGSAEGVEEAMLDVALELEGVEVVGAGDLLIGGGVRRRPRSSS